MTPVAHRCAYTLPDGNVAIAFSGGRTSAFMLHEILRVNGPLPERAVVTFQNTGREMPQTLDFVQECSERWGVRVVWLEYRPESPWFEVVSHNSAARDGEPFEALIRKYRRLPNKVAKFCTSELKRDCQRRYMRSLGWKRWSAAIGIRADEPRRIPDNPRRDRVTTWYPLFHAGATKSDVVRFWRRQPFDLRLPMVKGKTIRGNCDRCFHKGEAERLSLDRDFPDRSAWWERMEDIARDMGATGDKANFRIGATVADDRDFVRRQGDWIFDTEGALCQADDGECV